MNLPSVLTLVPALRTPPRDLSPTRAVVVPRTTANPPARNPSISPDQPPAPHSKCLVYFPVLAFALLSCAVLPVAAQTAPPLSVTEIYAHGSLTGTPPSDFTWSPDSTHLLYQAENSDLMTLDTSGHPSVLLDHSKFSVLTNAPAGERDRDHRARYGQPNFIWGPDSKHLLIDTAGDLVIYSPETGTGLQIESTGTASGEDPKFSPNGAYVSYIRNHNLYLRRLRAEGEEMLLSRARNPKDSDSSHLVLSGEVDWVYEEELDVRSNYFWSPDSRRLAYLEMDESAVPEYPIEDWLPVHSGVDRQRYPQPGDPNPAVRLGVTGAETGKTAWIKLPLAGGEDYIPRFGWIDARTLWIEVLARNQQRLDLYFADAQSGASRLMLSQADDKFLDANYDIDFTTSAFFLRSWRDGHTHIYAYSFNPGNPLSADVHLVRQLTSGPYEVAAVSAVDEATRTIYYLSNEGNPLGQQIWAVQWDGNGKRRLSSSPGFHQPIFAGDGGYYVDTASDAHTPPAISLCRKQECTPIWTAKQLPTPLNSEQTLELKAADGATVLYGTLLVPPGPAAPASVPLIVNPYGGPGIQGVRDVWGGAGRLFDELLAAHGFAVLHVDNRGMGGRGRDFAQAAYHNFGPMQLADQLGAVDQVLGRFPVLDGKRLGWWGWSWGGSFTLYALTHSDRFRAGAAGAPVTDWRDYDSIYTERYLGLPAANPDVYRDQSVVNSAASLKGRLLLLHGTGDDNVHLENTVQFIQQLIQAGVPYDFQIYPRKTHSVRGPETRIHLYTRLLDHFDTYLKPPQPAEHPPGQ